MDFPKLIKQTREKLGETQVQFGERFGVERSTIEGWELEKRQAPYKVLAFCLEYENNLNKITREALYEEYMKSWLYGKFENSENGLDRFDYDRKANTIKGFLDYLETKGFFI